MPDVDRNGRVLEKRPLDLNRIIEILAGLWVIIVHFITALFVPFRQENLRDGNRRDNRWGSGNDFGGDSGGGGDGGGGPGSPP